MNTHPEDAKAYSDLKIALAKKYADNRYVYTEIKPNLYKKIDTFSANSRYRTTVKTKYRV